ncbi:MAG TPA: ABC transporter ATP-binding protein [Edaphocola sp.]|nr:ABC transporter ATP-binding protein [Edaphocola sp.]
MLQVKNLHITFAGTPSFHALQGINFSIAKGKTVALIGASGSGKSLTSLAVMGLLPKNATQTGYLILGEGEDEKVLNTLKPKEWQSVRGKEISMIFQEPMSALNPIMKVGEQLLESIITHQKISLSEGKILAIKWLEKVKIPNPKSSYNRYPHQLSGGQKQRVMIAMAMCNHPKVLIADEPTTALDVTVQKEIILLMKELQQEFNTALLFITHDLALAKEIADDYVILEKGKVVKKMFVSEFKAPEIQDKKQNVLLNVEHLKVYYPESVNWSGKVIKEFKAVDDVSFQVNKGDRMGLVGESGCGKTTLSKCILGLQQSTSGNILFKDKNLTQLKTKDWYAIRKSIQIIFQDPYASLNPRLNVFDILSEPMLVHSISTKKEVEKKVIQLLDQVQLTSDAIKKYPHEFSGGQRQRICIARALSLQPELLICDESVAALDVKIQAQILELLYNIQQEHNLTYLFITHDLNVVKSFCNKVLVMEKGKIVEQGLTATILNTPEMDYTKKLLAAIPGAE